MKFGPAFSSKFILSLSILSIMSVALNAENARQVSSRNPVIGHSREMAAERPATAMLTESVDEMATKPNPWKELATLPGAVVHDISFSSLKVGYAAAELGQVWKTTDGGAKWTEILNLGFPYYWYGVHALTGKDVVISGFNDQASQGIIRWSHDGGKTWTGDVILTSTGWSDRVRFIDSMNGLVVDQLNTQAPNAAHYTTDGGKTASDWTEDVPDPNGGWFGDEFSFMSNKTVRMSGITYCASPDGGATWSCGPSVDSVFDGPVFFANKTAGWVGGGEISPQVEGWAHRTTDGGKTWSGRVLDIAWPVREILFLTPMTGWAVGGNIYSNVGGMYFSRNGGKTWSLDLNSNGAEMSSCDSRKVGRGYQVWCAGYDSSFNGVVYGLKLAAK
jgi:photosystem II stability/assembly factor-like uncharacterized protein